MSPSNQKPEFDYLFSAYLQFISDMLGGDIFPLKQETSDIHSLICERAIDYSLIKKITAEIQKHNAVFQLNDRLQPYPTLDALGSVRAHLLDHKGDIHQISLVDRIGELSVSFFNLPYPRQKPPGSADGASASVHSIRRKRAC